MSDKSVEKRAGLRDLSLDGGFGGLGPAAFAQTEGVAADVHDSGFVEQAIECSGGHDEITGEDVRPIGEGLVEGQHDGATGVVALTDDLEQRRSLGLIEREVTTSSITSSLGRVKFSSPGEGQAFNSRVVTVA